MTTRRFTNADGFTLVELMMVVLIIGTLLLIAVPLALTSAARASATTCLANRSTTEHAEFLFELEARRPSASIDELIAAGYMKSVPVCPKGGVYIWQEPKILGGVRTLACSIHHAEGLQALFASEFTDMTGLTPLMGSWSVVNGRLVADPNSYQNRISFGSPTWTDYTLSLNAKLDSGAGYGVYYRADGNSNISGYVFQFDPGLGNKFAVRIVQNGAESGPIQKVSMPPGFDIYGTEHKIEISVVGTHQIIKVDGQVVMEFDDKTFSSGSAGLRTWSKSSASFDNLTVAPVLGK